MPKRSHAGVGLPTQTASSVPGVPGAAGPAGADGLPGQDGVDGASPEELLALLRYAFERIDFLEAALGITRDERDLAVPIEMALLTD